MIRGLKLSGQRTSLWAIRNRERTGDLQASCGEGLGSDGTVNTSELLINIVTVEKPKMLTGFTKR